MYKIHKHNLVSIVITDIDSAELSSMIMKIEQDFCAICSDADKYVKLRTKLATCQICPDQPQL
jgi:hypothetical protein